MSVGYKKIITILTNSIQFMFVPNFAKDSLLVILSLEKHIQAGLREVNKAKMRTAIYLLGDELFLYVPFFCVT